MLFLIVWSDQEKLNDNDINDLDRPFDEVEIKHALFQMEPNIAAGLIVF